MSTATPMSQSQFPLRIMASLALGIGIAATLLAFYSLDGFGEDEFFQITFMNEGFPHFFVQFVRLDQHPAFHFLQMKLWGTLFSSDKGLLLNSVVWHLISVCVIFWVGRAWLGLSAALLAAAFYVLAPQVVSASVSLRFYSMIPALAVGAWWLNYKLLSSNEKRWWPWVALIAVQLALGYTHAIAFYFVAWIALAAAVQVVSLKISNAPWKRWFAVQSGVAVLLLPLLVLAVVRVGMPGQTESGGNNDPGSVVSHLGRMIAGWGNKSDYQVELGAALYLTALALGLWNKKTRLTAAVILIGPYAIAFIVALILAPMYKTPVYSAMLVPFACLVLGGGLMALKNAWGTGLSILLLTGMCALVFPTSKQLVERVSPYKPLVAELKQRVLPGDVVVVPKPYLYWAVMRYAVGPNWGSPLEVLPSLNANWQKVIGKLDPDLAVALKLIPKTDKVVHEGITYVIGEDALRDSAGAKRVWVIQRNSYLTPPRLAEGFVARGVVATFGDTETTRLELFERP